MCHTPGGSNLVRQGKTLKPLCEMGKRPEREL